MDYVQVIMMLDTAVLNTRSRLDSCIQTVDKENSTVNTVDLGLLVRLLKLLNSFMRSARFKDGMTATIMERCIYETCITIRYLAEKGTPEMYQAFLESDAMRKHSLVDFLENFDHPSAKLMEGLVKQLKKEITELGFDEAKLGNKIPPSWHPKIRYSDMAKELDDKALQNYQVSYARSSETLHQSWSDIIRHHVTITKNGVLKPNLDNDMVTVSAIANVTCNVLSALESFCANKPMSKTTLQMVQLTHKGLHAPPTNSFVAVGNLPYDVPEKHPFFDD
jgi:hypothetical protein